MSVPRTIALECRGRLRGPGERQRTSAEPVAVTGGGLVGVVDLRAGLRSVWKDEREPVATVELAIRSVGRTGLERPGRRPGVRPLEPLRAGGGGWTREIRLGDGRAIREVGLFPDILDVPVIEWTLEREPGKLKGPGGPDPSRPKPSGSDTSVSLELRIRGPGGETTATEIVLDPDRPRATGLVTSRADPHDERRIRRLLAPIAAREKQRRGRRDPAAGFGVELDGSADERVQAALNRIDDASLRAPGRASAMSASFLAGLQNEVPTFLESSGRAELGIAALVTGRTALADALLDAVLAAEMNTPPVAALALAARYAHWTGNPQRLTRHADRLIELVRRVRDAGERAALPANATLPSPLRAVSELLEGLEPLGEVTWVSRLEVAGRAFETARTDTPGRTLPVLGSPGSAAAEVDAPENEPSLPTPDAFDDSDGPGLVSGHTLHAARFLRSWVEGLLGARPDGSYGRLRLAPQLEGEHRELRVGGIRVGDAFVRLGYRREGATHTFSLRQTAGRVPLNLVFEPRLPLSVVESVRIGGERVDVEVSGDGETSSIRCQFPLDPDREVTVVGRPSNPAAL